MKNIVFIMLFLFSALCFAAETDKSLIIVTTDYIADNSAQLSLFIAEKEKRGFSVLLGSERDFGGEDLKGYEKAKKIREWLKNNSAGYKFLLLIGNPNTKSGNIPMVLSMPSGPDAPDACASSGSSCTKIPTDYFYADLSGEYDLNNDGVVGQAPFDLAEGGIDFGAELYVGRIPLYFDDIEELDVTLSHTINYMNTKESEALYRKKMLFPMSFIWFKGYKVFQTMDENEETAETSEWFIRNILKNYSDISYSRLYESEGFYPSRYEHERALTHENIIDEWKKGYGMVFWGGHGMPTGVVRTVWLEDKNNNNLGENEEVASYDMVNASDGKLIASGKPAFVVAISCLVGNVESPGSITHKFLADGAAVGIISASSVTDPSFTPWHDMDSQMVTTTVSEDTGGVVFLEGMIKGGYAGQIFYDYKKSYGQNPIGRVLDHKFMLNYFGDPSLTLYDTKIEETPDSEPKDDEIIVENDSDAVPVIDENNDSTGNLENDETTVEEPAKEKSKSSGGCSMIVI